MLKPIGFGVYLDYRCPKCELTSSVPLDEIQKIGQRLCWCGHVLKFAPVYSVKVEPNFGGESLKFESIPRKVVKGRKAVVRENSDGDDMRDVLAELRRLGVKVSEGRILIEQAIRQGINIGDVDGMVEFILTKCLSTKT